MPLSEKSSESLVAALTIILATLVAQGASGDQGTIGGKAIWPEGITPVTWECLADSALRFGLPEGLLVLVMEVESGQVGRISRNRNGTYDMGPMQINSFWLPRLKALGITEGAVTDHGCVNLAVGAWLLRSHLKRTGRLDRAVSDYHSLNPELGKKYLLAAKARAKNLDPSKTILRANGFLK